MKPSIQWSIAFPIFLLVLQAFVLLMLTLAGLRRRKLITYPIGAMDYGAAIYVGAVILGVFILIVSDVEYLFRSYKAAITGQGIYGVVFSAFSRFFIVLLAGWVLHLTFSWSILQVLGQRKGQDELVNKGNVPLGIVCGIISVGFAWLLAAIAASIYEWLTPVVFNFA